MVLKQTPRKHRAYLNQAGVFMNLPNRGEPSSEKHSPKAKKGTNDSYLMQRSEAVVALRR